MFRPIDLSNASQVGLGQRHAIGDLDVECVLTAAPPRDPDGADARLVPETLPAFAKLFSVLDELRPRGGPDNSIRHQIVACLKCRTAGECHDGLTLGDRMGRLATRRGSRPAAQIPRERDSFRRRGRMGLSGKGPGNDLDCTEAMAALGRRCIHCPAISHSNSHSPMTMGVSW
jgi:hypothetical protein